MRGLGTGDWGLGTGDLKFGYLPACPYPAVAESTKDSPPTSNKKRATDIKPIALKIISLKILLQSLNLSQTFLKHANLLLSILQFTAILLQDMGWSIGNELFIGKLPGKEVDIFLHLSDLFLQSLLLFGNIHQPC